MPLPPDLARRALATLRRLPLLILLPALPTAAALAQTQTMAPDQSTMLNAPIIPPNVQALADIKKELHGGDQEKALELADKAVEDFPRDAQLRFVHAVILSDLKRTDQAVVEFESMTSQFPELPEPYNNLAVIRAAQGKYAEALQLLQQALTAQPDYATARENLGDLYIAMAVSTYERAARQQPGDVFLKRKLELAREVGAKLRGAREH